MHAALAEDKPSRQVGAEIHTWCLQIFMVELALDDFFSRARQEGSIAWCWG